MSYSVADLGQSIIAYMRLFLAQMTVSVIDESCPTRAEAIQINVFYPAVAQMPKIKVHKVACTHRVYLQSCTARDSFVCHCSLSATSFVSTRSSSSSTKAMPKVSVCKFTFARHTVRKASRHVASIRALTLHALYTADHA